MIRCLQLGTVLIGFLFFCDGLAMSQSEDIRDHQNGKCDARLFECEDACHCHEDRHARAGYANTVSRLARPATNHHYRGGYIGGGAPFHFGEPRAVNEGTWGTDYSGVLFHRRVWLNWWHGAKQQGGTGAYKTDGPHIKHHH